MRERSEMPPVLIVDQDADALNTMLLRLEPVFIVQSMRTLELLRRYVKMFAPAVLVIADDVTHLKFSAAQIVSRVRAGYDGAILVLTEVEDDATRARWREVGATDCIVHPTRIRNRLERFVDKVLDLGLDVKGTA